MIGSVRVNINDSIYVDMTSASEMLAEIKELRAQIEALTCERDAYKLRCRQEGVCMTCVLRAPEPYGCSDCLNTHYAEGEPAVLVAERENTRRLVECVRAVERFYK
jgi:hypothetical protein